MTNQTFHFLRKHGPFKMKKTKIHYFISIIRLLPEWARNIFTDKMLAASNVKGDEVDEIISIALGNLSSYFIEIGESSGAGNRDEVAAAQNYYCENQQMNPHTPNVMKSLGLDEADVEKFCTDMLFPKIV